MPRLSHAAGAAVAIGTILAVCTGLMLAGGGEDPGRAAPGLSANVLPGALDGAPASRIRLRGARGEVIDTARLRGRPYLVTFLYTSCPDACPLIGYAIADALRRLGPRGHAVSAVGVSVDPGGDTAAAARRWTTRHRLPSEFHYALGSRARLKQVWRDWYVVPGTGTLSDPRAHDASVWLVDARGHLRGRWDGGAPIDPQDVAHDLGTLLDEAH